MRLSWMILIGAPIALAQPAIDFSFAGYGGGGVYPQRPKVTTLSAEEFIRQFLQHALPRGFQRIRYFGLLAHCHRAEKLERCRRLLALPFADLLPQPTNPREIDPAITGRPLRLCPQCGVGILARVEVWPPCHGPVPLRVDTS